MLSGTSPHVPCPLLLLSPAAGGQEQGELQNHSSRFLWEAEVSWGQWQQRTGFPIHGLSPQVLPASPGENPRERNPPDGIASAVMATAVFGQVGIYVQPG